MTYIQITNRFQNQKKTQRILLPRAVLSPQLITKIKRPHKRSRRLHFLIQHQKMTRYHFVLIQKEYRSKRKNMHLINELPNVLHSIILLKNSNTKMSEMYSLRKSWKSTRSKKAIKLQLLMEKTSMPRLLVSSNMFQTAATLCFIILRSNRARRNSTVTFSASTLKKAALNLAI